jgi:phosphoribosylformylglycinamidine synthase
VVSELMRYLADVTIKLKKGVRDPEGMTITRALRNLGFSVEEVSSAKKYYVLFEAEDDEEAENKIEEMCRKLLSNPIIHDYSYTLEVKG